MSLLKDLQAFSGRSRKKMIITIVTNPCFHSLCLYRLASFFYRLHLSPVSKIIWYINRLLYHIDIDYRCNMAGGVHQTWAWHSNRKGCFIRRKANDLSRSDNWRFRQNERVLWKDYRPTNYKE